MPEAYFEVDIKFNETGGGRAEIAAPVALAGSKWGYVLVHEAEPKAIVRVEAGSKAHKAIAADPACRSLTDRRLEALKDAYPKPRLKQKYRRPPASEEVGERTLETFQTVRWKFYLIDVPVLAG